MLGRFTLLLFVAAISYSSDSPQLQYAGPERCASCHRDIAATQMQTAMANTWGGAVPSLLDAHFEARRKEESGRAQAYEVRSFGGHLEYFSVMPDGAKLVLPVEAVIGGRRNGLSFLERIEKLDEMPIQRPTLIEGRYAYSLSHRSLELSPGFDPETPATYGDALGRVLSPEFEEKCLRCHGEPNTLGAGKQGGVRCESCHGPALDHVRSFTAGTPGHKLVTPKKLAGSETLAVCAQCHTGLSEQSDPLPDDLLVSSQVPALSHSECFIQSGQNLTCVNCHNPHQDSPQIVDVSQRTCLGCHSISIERHAAICPVNANTGCITCHMPSVERNAFHLTDHWIRVHPEQGLKAAKYDDSLRSKVQPKREFLRIIVVENPQQAEAAKRRLRNGEPFAKVAHDASIDPTAPGGGYIGEMELSELDAKIAAAAAQLQYGETSGIVNLGDRCIILQRMQRDFKWRSGTLFQQASALKSKGDLKGAIEKDQQALEIYPYSLRALVLMATIVGETGDRQRASEILRFAVQFYPKDPSAQFDLALTLGHSPVEQIAALRRVIDLDPEMIAAYESLGAALFASGQPESAIETFRRGLQVDPLSAILNYDLGLALSQKGDRLEAARALALATKIEPSIALTHQK